ncbi:MAG: cytochrome-c oxidase, cbb3-type subunit I [Bacteroidia bacterium]|jgi:cytochrome c oxidase cbb3-type subunit I/II|nr:cytochrome-c oxidase, cbb3-type subunit I [Bacteroidia bacterium]
MENAAETDLNKPQAEKFAYDNTIVKMFAYATMLWGVVGMLAGLYAALALVYPSLNLGLPQTSFGRVRPLHTNAVIFAFVGNGIFMGVYYSLQRLCKARMFSDKLSKIHFWGWQLIIVLAAVTLLWGYTTGKEYAELEWPIDILIALIWVVFGWNMFGTILKRRERHLYVAIWFYIATFVTVAMLHIVNSFELPISLLKSYSWYAGVQDALVQWWYGHNAVAFFLTTPYLGLMYYFIPKAANRPVYSYRLSIIHFWALIFLYIWAGPHHLLYSTLPDWAQSLGVVFSVMLIAPSWGGMINGLLTLRGVWDKVREDVVLKFLVVAITAYGMATFEGPMLSLKNVNAIAHFTDWVVAHVHVGALGWNGFLTFGILYWLIPKMWGTSLWSKKLAGWHFWLGTLGILFYAIPMYWAGWVQHLMWKQFTPDGRLLYPNFLETVTQLMPMYMMRALGGTLYLVGAVIMVVNLIKTVKAGKFIANENAEVPALPKTYRQHSGEHWHRAIERRPVQLLILSLVIVGIGGILELVPTFLVKSNVPTIASVKPYTPLELHGRDIYVREGCYVCHSQLIRPFRFETVRYGEYSKAGEFVYDHPFQWGSKRTGPDLAREGTGNNKKSNLWHYNHLADPGYISQGSIMPSYIWLLDDELDTSTTAAKIRAMQTLGVPYPQGYDAKANAELMAQEQEIFKDLMKDEEKLLPNDNGAGPNREVIALIAYLQRLGRDIEAGKTAEKK